MGEPTAKRASIVALIILVGVVVVSEACASTFIALPSAMLGAKVEFLTEDSATAYCKRQGFSKAGSVRTSTLHILGLPMEAVRMSTAELVTPRSTKVIVAVECLKPGQTACKADSSGNIGSGNRGKRNFGTNNVGDDNIEVVAATGPSQATTASSQAVSPSSCAAPTSPQALPTSNQALPTSNQALPTSNYTLPAFAQRLLASIQAVPFAPIPLLAATGTPDATSIQSTGHEFTLFNEYYVPYYMRDMQPKDSSFSYTLALAEEHPELQSLASQVLSSPSGTLAWSGLHFHFIVDTGSYTASYLTVVFFTSDDTLLASFNPNSKSAVTEKTLTAPDFAAKLFAYAKHAASRRFSILKSRHRTQGVSDILIGIIEQESVGQCIWLGGGSNDDKDHLLTLTIET
ncbi:hypothetical protein ACKKBF_B40760 [Auxenochlorella protothecoides x Auxenochlorella symbiontica]